MQIIGKGKLDAFAKRYPDSSKWISNWIKDTETNLWATPQDVKQRYAHASFLSDNRVIFNVRGNNYRLEVKVSYKNQVVIVAWIGTHAEYDKR